MPASIPELTRSCNGKLASTSECGVVRREGDDRIDVCALEGVDEALRDRAFALAAERAVCTLLVVRRKGIVDHLSGALEGAVD